MALSFKTVEQAYEIFGLIKKEFLPDLNIPSWPSDMGEWGTKRQTYPPVLEVLGWGKKQDDGWESICFFIQNPSKELIDGFEKLNTIKGNTHICKPYDLNDRLFCIGWF
ncbi:hypothetical protein SAMN04515674_101451 [Pseudarcicella hirudinis]|uniref:Uncharacterized protein n=1 Tax=Pseudarcicella hirudinis TaxID=1079859 RepID=A0A1I5MU70_9BACT|nr:hypothetical protein [Pseudarcicella hirudinis]SFP13114.1 hypothetical protein SAMN04515674_101451 [Pseudarcicella hirudinis]